MGGRGHAAEGGGAMEYVVTSLATIRDGRNLRGELFDADEEPAAMARFEELRGRRRRVRRPRDAASNRFVAAYNAPRLGRRCATIFAPDLRFIDRRLVGWGEHDGPDTLLEFLEGGVELAPDARMRRPSRSRSDDRAAVVRYLPAATSRTGGGEAEVEFVSLSLIDGGRVIVLRDLRRGRRRRRASTRFEEIGAATDPERVLARICRLVTRATGTRSAIATPRITS